MIASGSKYARFFVLWSDVEPTRGAYDSLLLQTYQDQFGRLNAAGVKPVSSSWARRPGPTAAATASCRRATPRDFGAFVGFLASQLRGKVAGYEIWNEPDEAAFWHGGAPTSASTPRC